MLFFGGRNKRRNISLIFDIGSSSVGGAIVRYDDEDLPEILFTVRRKIDLRQDFEFDAFFNSMLRSLEVVAVDVLTSLADSIEDVAESLEESGKRVLGRRVRSRIKNVYCVFGLPWYKPTIEDIRHEFDGEKPVTSEMVLKMIREAGNRARESFSTPEAIGVLEEKILEYRLNGYRLDEPTYSQAKTIDLKLYLSTVSKSTMRAIRVPIRKSLSFRRVDSFSFLMIFFSVLRDLYPDKNTFLSLDMRGEVTEVGISEDDILLKTVSIPHGKNTLIRRIADTEGLELFDAEAKLSLYFAGKLESASRAEIEKVIEQEIDLMRKKLLERLGNVYLPKLVFVLSDEDMESFAARTADAIYDSAQQLEIIPLSEKYFKEFVSFSKARYRDHFLALAALYFRSFEVDN